MKPSGVILKFRGQDIDLPAGGAFFPLPTQRKESAEDMRHTAKGRAAQPLRLPCPPGSAAIAFDIHLAEPASFSL